jgi:hypothetical protein
MDKRLKIFSFAVFFHPGSSPTTSLALVRISEGMLPEPSIRVKYAPTHLILAMFLIGIGVAESNLAVALRTHLIALTYP